MTFEFATAGRIVFGESTLPTAAEAAVQAGRIVTLVTGRSPHRAERLRRLLEAKGAQVTIVSIAHEPTTDDVLHGARVARETASDVVIGFGGGSAMDAAKAIAVLVTNGGDLFDYLEVVGRAQPLASPGKPCITIPTTAGTGAEVTRNAVLGVPAHRVKVSLRSPFMLPRVAVVDPELTYELGPALTAATGLDALTQLIEPYVSVRANPLIDPWCIDGITRIARALPRVCRHGSDREARRDMALASLYGGLALANAGLGAVHGFAGPIGGAFDAPHGAVCGALLPHVVAVNLRALRARSENNPALRRYAEIARLVTGRPQAGVEELVAWLGTLVTELGVPPLGHYGITPADAATLVPAAMKASSMKANPIVLTADECREILAAAL